jgi:hypothetical protein
MSKMVAPQMAAVNRDGCGVLNSNEPRWGSDQPLSSGNLRFRPKLIHAPKKGQPMNRTQFDSNDCSRSSSSWMHRRGFLLGAGAAGMTLGTGLGAGYTQIAGAADHTLRIAPQRLELAPGKVIDTFAYNGKVPGPALRLREGHQVSIDIRNDTDIDDIVHWHGLYVPAEADGAMEEGSRWSSPGRSGATPSRQTPAARAGTTATMSPGPICGGASTPGCTGS